MKLNEGHLAALSRAIHFETDGITDKIEEKHLRFILRDIQRLKEIRKVVMRIVFEPTLPLEHVQPSDPKELARSGHIDTKS